MRSSQIIGFSRYTIFENGDIVNTETGNKISYRMNNGYKIVTVSQSGNRKTFNVHRLLAIAFIPNPENKPCVNHLDGVRSNNKIENLQWVTYSENAIHSFDTTLRNKRKAYKLTNENVLSIRRKYTPYKHSYRKIATEFNVAKETIRDIINNKIWKL